MNECEVCYFARPDPAALYFVKASGLTGEWSNAVFYMGTCLVMLQYFAVYITLGRK